MYGGEAQGSPSETEPQFPWQKQASHSGYPADLPPLMQQVSPGHSKYVDGLLKSLSFKGSPTFDQYPWETNPVSVRVPLVILMHVLLVSFLSCRIT